MALVASLAELCILQMVEFGIERFPVWLFAKLPEKLVQLIVSQCRARGLWNLGVLQQLGFCNLPRITLNQQANDAWLAECPRHQLKELYIESADLTWSSHKMVEFLHPNLETLSISRCSKLALGLLSPTASKHDASQSIPLSGFPSLTSLELSKMDLTDSVISQIFETPSLQYSLTSLNLGGNSKLSNKGLSGVSKLLKLQHLVVEGTLFSECETIHNLPLVSLDASWSQARDKDVFSLNYGGASQTLESLSLESCNLTEQVFMLASEFPNLTSLNLSSIPLSSKKYLRNLANSTSLTSLNLAGTDVFNAMKDLKTPFSFPNLRTLNLAENANCTAEMLSAFCPPQLSVLSLASTRIDDHNFAALFESERTLSLRTLVLNNTLVSECFMSPTVRAALSNLEVLDLACTAVTNKSIHHLLTQAFQLKTLSLANTPVSESAFPEALSAPLASLNLQGTCFSSPQAVLHCFQHVATLHHLDIRSIGGLKDPRGLSKSNTQDRVSLAHVIEVLKDKINSRKPFHWIPRSLKVVSDLSTTAPSLFQPSLVSSLKPAFAKNSYFAIKEPEHETEVLSSHPQNKLQKARMKTDSYKLRVNPPVPVPVQLRTIWLNQDNASSQQNSSRHSYSLQFLRQSRKTLAYFKERPLLPFIEGVTCRFPKRPKQTAKGGRKQTKKVATSPAAADEHIQAFAFKLNASAKPFVPFGKVST